MRRLLTGLGLALAALSLSTTATLAGGWAWVTADNPPPDPREGETVAFGFTVLQHGQTPVDWVTATVVARNTETGAETSFTAAPEGKTGHYVSQVALSEAGTYAFEVRLAELQVESGPLTVPVRTASGALPETSPAQAIEQAKKEMNSAFASEIAAARGEMAADVTALQATVARLQAANSDLAADRKALTDRIAALEATGGTDGLPIVALLAIAALAGAIGGIAIVALGRRRRSDEPVPALVPTTR